MKTVGVAWCALLRAMAVIIVLLFVPFGASAHSTSDRAPLSSGCAEAGQDAVGAFTLDCMRPASGHCVHCRFISLPPVVAGPNPSLGDDQSVAAAPVLPSLTIQFAGMYSAPASRIPVAALPRFILFGNFRS